jgi:transcription elongation factor Elf1
LKEGEQEKNAEAFVRLSRSADKQSCKDFVQGIKQLSTVPLKLNGKASWDKMLDAALDEQQNSQDICTWKKGDTHYGESAPNYFQCPKCEHVEQSSCKNFQTKDLDTKQRCNGCNISTKVSEWKCTCRNHWHNCDVHRHCVPVMNAREMSITKRERNFEDTEDAARIKKAPKLDYSIPIEQMLEQEIRQEKRKRMEEDEWLKSPTFELGFPRIKTIRVATLTPNLKRKFIHPGGL